MRGEGWDIPPLANVDQTDQVLRDDDVTVVASTAVGSAEGRKIVDRSAFEDKIRGFEEANRKALENAVRDADAASKDMDATLAKVKDPDIRAALKALAGRTDTKRGK